MKRVFRTGRFIAFSFLAGCATMAPNGGSELAQLHLFTDSGMSRFSFYFSCAGQAAVETQMCWVPSKYFALWAEDRHVSITQLNGDAPFDATLGVPASQIAKTDSGLDYRIVVRFAPVALPSNTSENDGMGGYIPPKAGYQADLFVYATATGKLVTQASYHKKTEAKFKADAVPYVKAGTRDVLAAIDPAYAQAATLK